MPSTPSQPVNPSRPGRSRPGRISDTGERVFQSLSLGLVVFDRQLEVVQHNPASSFLVAGFRSIAEALKAGTVESTYQDWPRFLREVIDHGHAQRLDQVLYREADQRERLLSLQCIPLPDPQDGQINGGVLVIEDITLTVSLEKRLAVSERLAAVGKLAARVAHELNNPLDGILRYLNLAARAIETNTTDKTVDYLARARGGLLRMTEIIRELSEFSRSAHTAFDDTGLNSIIEEAIKVMSDKAVQGKVAIVCSLADNVPAIRGTNLFQVFCNLIKNAIDAMPQGGALTIATRVVDREVIVRFEDTGIGLPEEMERLFEPFFTTKPAGKGTGLGLAISKDIIEKYNGRIVPERREGGGAIFTVRVPLESCTEKGSGTFCRDGPKGASHKRSLTPFPEEKKE